MFGGLLQGDRQIGFDEFPMPNDIRTAQPKKQFYEEIHLFRGFAIFTIVLGHMMMCIAQWGGPDLSMGWPFLERLRDVLCLGNTAFFVFISGFLFFPIFYKRGYEFKPFMKGKLLKVFCPWLLIATIFVVWRIVHENVDPDSNFIIYCGYFYWSFWYVPFIMALFAVSGIFVRFIECSLKTQLIIFAASLLISMMLGRHNLNPVLSVIFWAPLYLAGILTAIRYEKLCSASRIDKEVFYGLGALLIGVIVTLDGYSKLVGYGPYEVRFGEHVEIVLIAKLFLCLALTDFFRWIKDRAGKCVKALLGVLADYAFSIFFLHQFFILSLERHHRKAWFSGLDYWGWIGASVLAALVVCALCAAFAWGIKKLTGRWSRMIIGT